MTVALIFVRSEKGEFLRYLILVSLACLIVAPQVEAKSLSAYYIGNSLTIDATYWTDGIGQMAASQGNSVSKGYHLHGGVGLSTIWGDAANGNTDVFDASPGYFNTALPGNKWDIVTLEPFFTDASSEIAAAQKFINLTHSNSANQQTKFFIYATDVGFPNADFSQPLDYQTAWNATYVSGDNNYRPSASYFAKILAQLRSDNPGVSIGMIPFGHVVAALDLEAKAGQIPGLSSAADIYRDGLHSNHIGQYAEAVTFYATMFGEDPRGTPVANDYKDLVTPAIASAIQNTVWQTINDNASLTLIPEPTGASLLALGCLYACFRRRSPHPTEDYAQRRFQPQISQITQIEFSFESAPPSASVKSVQSEVQTLY